ncbi:MAG: glyoxalase/bleomycin resistance/dioxygenase family protein [Acidobacteria bacterium]|nr:MAG: glyoxalase/bleomycin resistance/dioxygenase family protein [Acidobacteriota bacterium]REK02904.1 MAG: glyoxalase/bleomycin resistance/dioxygenase family protein [Acidobacteriota bacterium]REK13292.1 MAG: glyoxalase/bleomycin resistance/dioxygenase family protein [Acidobacteriota bacterium]REK41286.1 MAG: glyoxalase/bleomycin resistance/dioxygenase family protein [Acidobacteriota bacterium]
MKTHISLKVSDIKASTEFYTKMLGATPAKTREDYAKFDVNDPPLNLSLNLSDPEANGQLSHLGLQVESSEQVFSIAKRWESEGLLTLEEKETDCCYALQDKVWVTDPDGVHWEVFTVLADTEGEKKAASNCCELVPGQEKVEVEAVSSCC